MGVCALACSDADAVAGRVVAVHGGCLISYSVACGFLGSMPGKFAQDHFNGTRTLHVSKQRVACDASTGRATHCDDIVREQRMSVVGSV